MNSASSIPQPSPSEAIDAALELHRSGNLAGAEAAYRRFLHTDPGHTRVQGLLGACLAQAGRPREAIPLLASAAARQPEVAHLANLANALHADGRHEEALQQLQLALAQSPDHPQLHVNRANVLQALGRPGPAMRSCERALQIAPGSAFAWLARGDLQRRTGHLLPALESFDAALALAPGSALALYDRGVVLQDLERWQDAYTSYLAVLRASPSHVGAHRNLSLVCRFLERPDEALAWLDRALELCGDDAAILVSRGNLHQGAQRYEPALRDFDRALALGWTDPGVLFTRADALRNLRRHAQAVDAYAQALALRPDHPDAAKAHMNKGFCHLLLGQMEAGWPELEWRWSDRDIQMPHRHGLDRLWLGETDPSGRTILVHTEQGYGDTLLMCRYVPELARRGARVLLEAPPALRALLGSLEGCAQLVANADPPDFDLHVPMFSLPLAMHTCSGTLPAQVPYLRPPERKSAAWRERLGPSRRRRVGIAWAGNPTYRNDARRSMALARIEPLLSRTADIDWVSLQRDVAPGDRDLLGRLPLRRFDDEMADFTDTAALMQQLDLVLSVDTAIAHLAGALGRPVWVLLPLDPDWRWLLERADSPWYPTARLFRQKIDGDWDAVIEEVARAVAALP